MIKNRKKIKVISTEYGSLEIVGIPVKLHKDSFNNTDLCCLIPKTVTQTTSSVVKAYASQKNKEGEEIWRSETHNLPFSKYDSVNKFEYREYEAPLPEEFCSRGGDVDITFAYVDILEDGSLNERFTSSPLRLFISGEGFNSNGVQISNYDATAVRVNMLSELSVLKLDISKPLPLGVEFNLDGYKTPFYQFFTSDKANSALAYNLPILPGQKALRECNLIAGTIVEDVDSPNVIGYQTEFAFFSEGICKRVNKYNISQRELGRYALLETGEWQIVNQEYILSLKGQSDQNTEDIETLFKALYTGVTYLGEYPTGEEVPSDGELNRFVEERFGRLPQNGDELTFVKIVEGGTDIVYNIKYSGVSEQWTPTPLPTIEPASDDNLGLIKGGDGEDVSVSIESGKVKKITHVNENGQAESIHLHLNRNSDNIAKNATSIEQNKANIAAETERASGVEGEIQASIEQEVERAQTVENSLSEALTQEVERATAAEQERLEKQSINEDFLKNISFSLNGDTNVATVSVKNPVTGQVQEFELSVNNAASSTNAGLMTAEMVKALNNAVADIESLKYVGRQVASFQTYADAELYDWADAGVINENDYFIVQVDESRTEPTEKDKTTKYVCVNDNTPITLGSFRFQTVITTVNMQVSTETSLGGVLSTNVNGYIYVEPNGLMKLVGYDAILTSIANLTTNLVNEVSRAQEAEQTLSQAIEDETVRATAAENTLESKKADREELPTKTSELTDDVGFVKKSEEKTKTSQLTNDGDGSKVNGSVNPFALLNQVPTKLSQLADDINNLKRITFDDLGIEEFPISIKDLCNKIIEKSLTNAIFVYVNDNNNYFSDTPNPYGELVYITGNNVIRPTILFTKDVGDEATHETYFAYLIRSGNVVSSIDWRQVAIENSEPTFKNLNLIDDRDVSINFDNAEGTALNKIRAAKASKSLVFNSGGYYFRNINNQNNGLIIAPGVDIHPEQDNTIDLGISNNVFQNIRAGRGILKNTTYLVSDTPTTSSNTEFVFSDKKNQYIASIFSTIGSTWNALNLRLFNKAGANTTIEHVFDGTSSTWYFRPTVGNTIDLGSASRQWRNGFFNNSIKIGNWTISQNSNGNLVFS